MFEDLNHHEDKVFNPLVVEASCEDVEGGSPSYSYRVNPHLLVDLVVTVAKSSYILKNLSDEFEELKAVNVVLKAELSIVLKHFLKDLVWFLGIDSLAVRDVFNPLLSRFVIFYVFARFRFLLRDHNPNRLFDSALIEKHVA